MTREQPGVLMVTGQYFPELTTGGSRQCHQLVHQLRSVVRYRVLTTANDRSLPAEDAHEGVPIFRMFVDTKSRWSAFKNLVEIVRFMAGNRRFFSIVHLHGFSRKSMPVIVLSWLMGKRIAIKLTSAGHDDPGSIRSQGRFRYWCYSRAHMFFGVSPRLAALYEASGLPRDRFRLIWNGVDLERFRPASIDERRSLREELQLPPEATIILFVGFFSREKRPDWLFDAWARIALNGDASSVIVFVGATRSRYFEVDEGMADGIRARAGQLGLGERLRFVEATDAIDKYHRAADLFVLPSVREGLPNVLLEAMACGTACIATRLEGITDWLLEDDENGVLVPPDNLAHLEAALALLISQPGRRRALGARARSRIEHDFSLADTARHYLAAYRDLLAS